MKVRGICGLFVLASVVIGSSARAADDLERTLVINNHQFAPTEIEVPSGVRVKLLIDNQDATAEEFDSPDLRSEKVIPGNSKATVWIGPLAPGEYKFVGEFHEKTAQGRVIVK